jgi:hypothetical protein
MKNTLSRRSFVKRSALKAYWYEGLNPTTTGKPQGSLRAAKGDDRTSPRCASS